MVVVWVLIFAGAGLIAAASLIAWSWRELLTVAPLEVTGLVVSRDQLPDLWARIDRLAAKLGAEPPKQLILGLEPRAFVAAANITFEESADCRPLKRSTCRCADFASGRPRSSMRSSDMSSVTSGVRISDIARALSPLMAAYP